MSSSVSRRSSSQYAERCKYCRDYPLHSIGHFVHVTETEMAHLILAGEVAYTENGIENYNRAYDAPLTSESRWIHTIKETENEDMGSAERHPDTV